MYCERCNRLVYREKCSSHSDALKREYAVKALNREEKLLLIGKSE